MADARRGRNRTRAMENWAKTRTRHTDVHGPVNGRYVDTGKKWPTPVVDGTLPQSSAESEFKGRHRVERVQNSEVPCVRYLIGRIVKMYDYINRAVLTLSLSVYEGTWTHSLLSLLCITMISRVRRNILKLLRSP